MSGLSPSMLFNEMPGPGFKAHEHYFVGPRRMLPKPVKCRNCGAETCNPLICERCQMHGCDYCQTSAQVHEYSGVRRG